METSQTKADERAELEAKYEEIRQLYKPLPFIPYDCNPWLFEEPKLAYYGVAVTDDELYAFGERHGLCPEPKDKNYPEALRRYEVYQAAVKLLSEKARWPLELHNPINPFLHWTVTLYSNYTIPVRRLSEEDEEEVIATILEELNLSEERDIFWHYDCFDGDVEMRLKPWETPSEKVKQDMKKLYDGWGHECDL